MSYYRGGNSVRQTKSSAFQGRPPASARKVANNTFSYTSEDGSNVIRLHTTDVVKILPDGRIQLDSGGWRSPTAKDRMNAHARGYMIATSMRGGWRVWKHGENEKSVAFYDGMILPDAIDNPSAQEQSEQRDAAAKKLKREIRDFANLYRESLPIPDGGDCWLCMTDCADTDHLLSHIEEGYAHGTLALNAMRWAGWTDTSIALHFRGSLGRDNVVRAVRRFLQFKLGLTY